VVVFLLPLPGQLLLEVVDLLEFFQKKAGRFVRFGFGIQEVLSELRDFMEVFLEPFANLVDPSLVVHLLE
jgi:hypothetical protein